MNGDWCVFRKLARTSKIGGAINFRCGHHRFNEALRKSEYPNVRYRRRFEYYIHLSRESGAARGAGDLAAEVPCKKYYKLMKMEGFMVKVWEYETDKTEVL